MMDILDFPPEVFAHIVHNLVTEAGINNSWRLRLVCKTFAEYIKDEIVKNQPLDAFKTKTGWNLYWVYPSNYEWSGVLKHLLGSYLFYKTMSPLKAHGELPMVIERSANWLLTLEPTTTTTELGDKGDEIKMRLCNMIADYDWLHVVRVLEEGIVGSKHQLATDFHTTLTSEEQDSADKLAVAAFFKNHDAISAILVAGVRPWLPSYAFGYCLGIVAMNGQPYGTIDAILGMLPRRLTNKTAEHSLILDMLYHTIETVSSKCEYDAAAYLTEWVSRHAPAHPKLEYDKVVYNAFRSQYMPFVIAALNLKVKGRTRKVSCQHFEEIIENNDIPSLDYIISKGYLDVNRYWYSKAPLAIAVNLGNVEGARKLLEAGAYPNGPAWKHKSLRSPLRSAVEKNSLPMVRLLLQYGASLHGHFGPTSNHRKMIFRCVRKFERFYEINKSTRSGVKKGSSTKIVSTLPRNAIYQALLRADRKEKATAKKVAAKAQDVDMLDG